MSEETKLAIAVSLAGFLGILVVLLFLWNAFREVTFRRLDAESRSNHETIIQELRVYFKQIDHVVLKIEGANQLDEMQQREIRQMLQIIETRILDAIQRTHPTTHIFNSQSTDGQTNQGVSVQGDQS